MFGRGRDGYGNAWAALKIELVRSGLRFSLFSGSGGME